MAVGSRCWDRCPEGCGRLGDKCPRLMPPLTKGISLAASGSGLAPVLQALAALKETPDLNFGAKFPYLRYWYLI